MKIIYMYIMIINSLFYVLSLLSDSSLIECTMYDSLQRLRFQNAYPARHNQFNVYNMGPVYGAILNIMMLFMTEKMRKRVSTSM